MITERERQILRWIEENPLISQQELAELGNITRSSVAVHISNLMKKGLIQGKGYILQKNPYIVVIGGVNMDIFGHPDAPLVQKDSNPGHVSLSAGALHAISHTTWPFSGRTSSLYLRSARTLMPHSLPRDAAGSAWIFPTR